MYRFSSFVPSDFCLPLLRLFMSMSQSLSRVIRRGKLTERPPPGLFLMAIAFQITCIGLYWKQNKSWIIRDDSVQKICWVSSAPCIVSRFFLTASRCWPCHKCAGTGWCWYRFTSKGKVSHLNDGNCQKLPIDARLRELGLSMLIMLDCCTLEAAEKVWSNTLDLKLFVVASPAGNNFWFAQSL